jgi:hypothetical protein
MLFDFAILPNSVVIEGEVLVLSGSNSTVLYFLPITAQGYFQTHE